LPFSSPAAAHAERNAAVHTARALNGCLLVGEARNEFAEMLRALLGRLVRFLDAAIFHEAGDFSHTD
jgi:hypothetical protein